MDKFKTKQNTNLYTLIQVMVIVDVMHAPDMKSNPSIATLNNLGEDAPLANVRQKLNNLVEDGLLVDA